MNTLIKYWSYLVENEDREISFETFIKKESRLFEASKKWPEDYLKQAKNLIMNSPLGKSDWYNENFIDQDLNTFKDEFDTLAHKGSFALGFFPSIIKWFIEYSGSDKQKYQEFIEGKLDKIIGILNFILSQKDDEVSQFHGISKEKDKDGNPLVLKFKKLKEMNWSDFDKNVFQKYSDQISNSVELKTDNKSSDYEAIPIYSYDELHDKFGGDKTGYKGRSEWCHTNGEGTYNSSSWTDDGRYMFIVFAKKNWENIKPPVPETTNAYDDYGTSLIACLFDTKSKKLLRSTLRWNHVIDPARTKLGASVDNAFKNENDLMNTVGIDLTKDLDEYFAKFRKLRMGKYIIIDGKEFVINNRNIDCSINELTSLKGAPKEVYGFFDCSINNLTSLEGAPQEVGKYFDCSHNKLTSLESAPQKVDGNFNCSGNKLASLVGAPQYISGYFLCSGNYLSSLKGAPKEVGGYFSCENNDLSSLEGAPEKVGEHFNCSRNKLTSLKGAPRKVSGSFTCTYNPITSLKGAPQEVGGDFYCHNNKLTSLEGGPQKVSRNFSCSNSKLTSLTGAPQEVGGNFSCSYNQLTSLEGAPKEVKRNFWCSNNELTSLKGAPEYVGGNFYCDSNKLTSLKGSPMEIGEDFDCSGNELTSLEGAPWKVVRYFDCSRNNNLPGYKVDAYRAYLKLSDSEKAPLTKDNHYYPTEEWENKFK